METRLYLRLKAGKINMYNGVRELTALVVGVHFVPLHPHSPTRPDCASTLKLTFTQQSAA